jgi:peptide/nickel transport system permease protein
VAGTAQIARVVRANLLDELGKPYSEMARAKGLPEWKLVLKYPTRVAIAPVVSTLGWYFPQLLSGGVVVSVVMSLPTIGPLLLRALIGQDMYLAGVIILLFSRPHRDRHARLRHPARRARPAHPHGRCLTW